MKTVTRVTCDEAGFLTADSWLTVVEDGSPLDSAPVPTSTNKWGETAAARMGEALRGLGFQPADNYTLAYGNGWIEFDVTFVGEAL